ncbi:hypothetical protein FRC19_010052 [Serendipita sp. 401]|nr:hypothetical protein FRC19_010052 [Serendipita sp. 401]
MQDNTHRREPIPIRKLTRVRTEVLATTINTPGLPETNPLTRPKSWIKGITHALLATAFFRCWHFILLYTLEAFIITYMYERHGRKGLAIENTLMNVLGTVLGFVISYRSAASFDRYNEGRRYWSQVVFNIRMFARTVWFHVPDGPGNMKMGAARTVQEYKARTLVEKKTVLNLLEAFAVALKHYLRGEEGTHYEDLYPLIKFLPAYALPAGYEVQWPDPRHKQADPTSFTSPVQEYGHEQGLPAPVTMKQRGPAIHATPLVDEKYRSNSTSSKTDPQNIIYLAPSRNPPPYHIFDFWPFYLFVRSLQKDGKALKGRKALRDRAKNRDGSDNVPLEITLYLSSYVAALQERGLDGLVGGTILGALGNLVDALTGLERILSTPVPWAYQVHLWTITLIWLFALPFQILKPLGWLTIPGCSLAAFAYCGLMKCAEELEDPFGYDYNDLNLDHFTHNIIRKELNALTSLPMPDPARWAFSPDNDAVFDVDGNAIYLDSDSLASPSEWVKRGEANIRAALSAGVGVGPSVGPDPVPVPPAVIHHSTSGNNSTSNANDAASRQQNVGNAGLVAGTAVVGAAAGMDAVDSSQFAFSSSPSPPPAPMGM